MPRAKRDIGRRFVHDDLDRRALDDLDLIAGGILGRQQQERGAGSGLNAGDMAAHRALRIGVDLERHLLPGPHAIELNLLKVRRDPDFVRHENCERGPLLRELANPAASCATRPA